MAAASVRPLCRSDQLFAQHYQPRMARLFGHSDPIDFGVGYQWRNPNLLAAVRTGAVASEAPANVPLAAAAASGNITVTSETASEATAAGAEETKPATSKPARKQAAGPKRTRKATNHYAAPWFLLERRFPLRITNLSLG